MVNAMTTNNPASPEDSGKPAFLIRGQKVQLDLHLAEQYGISVKHLKRQVRRHRERFPSDFMFELSKDERATLAAIGDYVQNPKSPRSRTLAFTEAGRYMLATILSSELAVEISLDIIRAVVNVHKLGAASAELQHRLREIELKHDQKFQAVFTILRQLQGFVENRRRPSAPELPN